MKRFLIRRPPQPSRLPWKAARGEEWYPRGRFIDATDPYHAAQLCLERGRGEIVVGVLIAIAPTDEKADEILAQANGEGGMEWEDAPEAECFAGFQPGQTGIGVIKYLTIEPAGSASDGDGELDDPESGEEWKRGGDSSSGDS